MRVLIAFYLLISGSLLTSGGVKDIPFTQEVASSLRLAPTLHGARFIKTCVQRDGIIYVLTDRGLARVLQDQLVLDRSFRPLNGKIPADIGLREGELFYLYEDKLLSNAFAGKYLQTLPRGQFTRFAFNAGGDLLLAGPGGAAMIKKGSSEITPLEVSGLTSLQAFQDGWFAGGNQLFHIRGASPRKLSPAGPIQALAQAGEQMVVGTDNGFFVLNQVGEVKLDRQTKLPALNITSILPAKDGIWFGTTQGVFHRSADGKFRYFASRRWLPSDHVLDLDFDGAGDLLVLTEAGLSRIQFKQMTLADKAAWYDNKIRQRHIRFGFAAELRLSRPGDISSAEMIDTDNDGTWSNYYMASQALRYGATKDEAAHRNAWQTFSALERLEAINPLGGFPSRTFERIGFRFSDPDRWHNAPDANWEWKAHTSSDEIIAHMFGSSILYECAAATPAEKARIATFIDKVLTHIVKNNWYLIDVDGKPTLWGRWNPEYVNAFPKTILDRKLNSAEIIGALQFGYKITGKELYKTKAFELMEQHGYLDNILLPLKNIAFTPGFKHLGIEMGDVWNHSDDLLSFDAYWVLYHYAFNNELKKKFAQVIREHWEIEKIEKNPLWNMVYASTKAKDVDVDGALWTLRGFPLDMIDWTVLNAHRRDLTPLPPNFRLQESQELLPPGERRMTRWNTHPFTLDGGSNGEIELAGDEYLLPYWMGRYLKVLE